MRHSTGYVRKQRGKWIGAWYANGKRTSKSLGLIKDLTKSEAKEQLAELIKESRVQADVTLFGPFVTGTFFPFCERKWKHSTKSTAINRINVHLVKPFMTRELSSFKRDELQDLLDAKAERDSYSLVNHLRWDLSQIFNMAVNEGHISLNPARLLFTPRTAKKPVHNTMTPEQVQLCLSSLAPRESLISKLALVAGMRPGEIFALRWGDIRETSAEVCQRVYEGVIDSPKSDRGYRSVALADGVVADLEDWRQCARSVTASSYVFPSEKMTPLSKRNVWNRNMRPKLEAVGLEWCTFQVMRRTFTSLCKANGGDAKAIADQCGHDIGVSLREYVQTPIQVKLRLVNSLEQLIK